jgi:predicted Holliday junction resolvase-like endonuclease
MDCDNYKLVSFIMFMVICILIAVNYSQYREIKYLQEKTRQLNNHANELSFLHRREEQRYLTQRLC